MDKEEIKKRQMEILDLIKGFTDEKLNDEYFELSKNLLMKLGRKREVPFVRGRLDIWAGGIIYAIGSINFLFDKSHEPYVSASEIADYFNSSKSTISSKARTINDLTKTNLFDSEFSTQHMKDKFPLEYMNHSNNLTKSNDGSIVSKSPINDLEVENELVSILQRVDRNFEENKKNLKQGVKKILGDEYSEDKFNQIMDIVKSPLDDEIYKLDNEFDFDKFDELDKFDDDEIIGLDELDEFDDDFDIYLTDKFDENYNEEILAVSYDVIFLEAIKSLISFFSMLLLRFKFNYINDDQDYLGDFDFNNDLSILYKEKHDEISNVFNRSTKRFDKILKKYNKDKNRFSNIKIDFDKDIQLSSDIEYIKKIISLVEEYLSDIEYVKELANRIITVDNNHDSYDDFKSVFKLVMSEILNIEKYYKEHINKLKNIKSPRLM